MKKFTILYFGPLGLQGGIGGAARVKNMLGVLKNLQIDAQLISYIPEGKFKVHHQQVGSYLKTTAIYFPKSLLKIFKLFALIVIAIYGLIRVRRYSIVLAHSAGIVYGFPALILAKIFNKPFIIDLTDSRDSDTPGFLYTGLLKKADAVFAVSQYLMAISKKFGCRRVIHVPGFIDTDTFRYNASARDKIRKELEIPATDIVIGYAGAFSQDEGLVGLFKAFEELSKRYSDIKLVLIGGLNIPGLSDTKPLNEAVSEGRVMFVPPQPYEVVPEYLSALDIACSPKIECAANKVADPIRVYEYMSIGLPVVASTIGETANVIEDGIDGFLFKPGNDEDLARVMEHIIRNLASLKKLGSKARGKVIRYYSQLAASGKIGDTLLNLTDESRP